MHIRWGSIGLVLGLIVVSCLFATEKLPVSIKGDALVYSDDLITASGNAELAYGEYTMLAEALEINTKTNLITGLGQARVARLGGETLTGKRFEYDINAEQLTMYDLDTRLQPGLAKEEILMRLDIAKNLRVTNNAKDIFLDLAVA